MGDLSSNSCFLFLSFCFSDFVSICKTRVDEVGLKDLAVERQSLNPGGPRACHVARRLNRTPELWWLWLIYSAWAPSVVLILWKEALYNPLYVE